MGFDSVFEYSIPYMHPLAVHFPLVLLLLACGAALVYAIRGTALWRHALLTFLALGAAAAFWAERTGEALEESMEGTPIVEELAGFHQQAAHWTVRASFLALLVGIGLSLWWRRKAASTTRPLQTLPEPLWMRLVLLLLVGTTALLVAYTAHIGGVMVWGV